jgi:hypothetical protein
MDRRSFPGLRWLGVALRTLHLSAVILLGAALMGAQGTGDHAAAAVAITGALMFVLDTWSKPSHLREVSGIAVMLKVVLVAWMAIDGSFRLALFWIVLAGSVVFAHAPAKFRHAVLIPPRS